MTKTDLTSLTKVFSRESDSIIVNECETLETLDLGTLGPLPSYNTSSYFPLHPLTSSYLFLLPSSFDGLVMSCEIGE